MDAYEDAQNEWITELEESNERLLEKCEELKTLLSDERARVAELESLLEGYGWAGETPY